MTPALPTHKKNTAGFTLVEVLVALAILGGGMFIIVNTHYAALHLHIYTVDEVDARMLLENTVGKAEMAIAGDETSGGGDFGPRFPGYSWSFEAQEMGSHDSPLLMDSKFYRVTSMITNANGDSKSLEFITFVNPESQTVQVY